MYWIAIEAKCCAHFPDVIYIGKNAVYWKKMRLELRKNAMYWKKMLLLLRNNASFIGIKLEIYWVYIEFLLSLYLLYYSIYFTSWWKKYATEMPFNLHCDGKNMLQKCTWKSYKIHCNIHWKNTANVTVRPHTLPIQCTHILEHSARENLYNSTKQQLT